MKNIDIPRLKEIATNFLRPIFFSSGESLRKKYGAHYKDIFLNAVMAASYEKNLSSLLTKVCNMLGIDYFRCEPGRAEIHRGKQQRRHNADNSREHSHDYAICHSKKLKYASF